MTTSNAVRATKLKIAAKQSELELAVRGFLLDRQARNLSPSTLLWYRRYTAHLASWLTERQLTDPAQVTSRHLREYLVDLQSQDISAGTVHHHARCARAFFNWLVEEEILAVSPMLRVKMPRVPQQVLPAFSEADVKALMAACDTDRNRAIVLCLLDTGARLREMCDLRVGDVELASGLVVITQGKNRKSRDVFLGAQTRRAVRRYLSARAELRDGDPLWLTERGDSGLSTMGVQRMLQRLGARAGIANCHPHTFRRTFAIASLRAGMDLVTLQRLMGHSDVKILTRYLDQNRDDLQAAHRQYGAVDSLLSKGRKR